MIGLSEEHDHRDLQVDLFLPGQGSRPRHHGLLVLLQDRAAASDQEMILAPALASRSERSNRSSSTGSGGCPAPRPAPRSFEHHGRRRVGQVGQFAVRCQRRDPNGLARVPGKARRMPPKTRTAHTAARNSTGPAAAARVDRPLSQNWLTTDASQETRNVRPQIPVTDTI